MRSRLKIVILLYDASTTFNVTVQYLQCKHFSTFARSRVRIVHEKSAYYTRVHIICDILR